MRAVELPMRVEAMVVGDLLGLLQEVRVEVPIEQATVEARGLAAAEVDFEVLGEHRRPGHLGGRHEMHLSEAADHHVTGDRPVAVEGRILLQPRVAAQPGLARKLGITADMRMAREEIFGPVAPVFKFDTEAEAIAAANATEFGLASYFFSRDIGRIWRVADALESGMPWINCWNLRVLNTPFGGWKNSGNGHREGR